MTDLFFREVGGVGQFAVRRFAFEPVAHALATFMIGIPVMPISYRQRWLWTMTLSLLMKPWSISLICALFMVVPD